MKKILYTQSILMTRPLRESRVFLLLLVFFLFSVHTAKSQTAYINNAGSANVSVIDLASNSFVKNIPVGLIPFGVVVHPGLGKAAVTNAGSNSVSIITTTTNIVSATIPVGNLPTGVYFNNAGTRLFVTNFGDGTISVINTATNAVIHTISGFGGPMAIMVSHDDSKLYVVNSIAGTVSVINATTYDLMSTIIVGAGPTTLMLHPTAPRLYVNNGASNSLSIINTSTNSVIENIALGVSPEFLIINPSGDKLYVSHILSGDITVISTLTNSIISTISGVCGDVAGLGFNAMGTKLIATCTFTNQVAIIDPATELPTNYIPVGASPLGFGDVTGILTPVELTAFEARVMGTAVELTWQTASELNNHGFEVERSEDGLNWEMIDFVEGYGTTQEVQNYRMKDRLPKAGINYYRLRQVDYDGAFAYSDIVSLHVSTEGQNPLANISVYPNPVVNQLHLENAANSRVMVYNALGQKVIENPVNDAIHGIDFSDMPSGQYLVNVIFEDGRIITKNIIK